MSLEFNRRSFLKYSAAAAVAVAGMSIRRPVKSAAP